MATTKKQRRGGTANPRRTLAVDDPLLTKEEVADLLGVTKRWVNRAVAERRFPIVKVGKLVRVRRSAVTAYIEAQSVPAGEGR